MITNFSYDPNHFIVLKWQKEALSEIDKLTNPSLIRDVPHPYGYFYAYNLKQQFYVQPDFKVIYSIEYFKNYSSKELINAISLFCKSRDNPAKRTGYIFMHVKDLSLIKAIGVLIKDEYGSR